MKQFNLLTDVYFMSIIFISDLHLDENHSEAAHIFLQFLNQQAHQAEALYILGDFFEAWIGDDDLSDFNQSIIHALQQVTSQGLPVYIMHGNRDFLIGKNFLRATGCKLLPEEYVVDIYGTPTLLMHGDTLCTLDVKYLKFRKKMRCWLIQKLILLKSLKKRRAMAAHYRKGSQSHVSMLAENIMDVTQDEVERIMQKHHVQHLIHGHTHRQAVHQFTLNNMPATRTVLGAWHGRGTALICHEDGHQDFIELST
jgi:UDP-2,3-diacylglucosamine hydrolase